MVRKKIKKETRNATRESVAREMALPRMARSARIAELKLNASRVPVQPSATMRGTVDKIILSSRPSKPEKARISLHGADRTFRKFLIENSLTDEYGDGVKLKKGAHVEVTVAAGSKT